MTTKRRSLQQAFEGVGDTLHLAVLVRKCAVAALAVHQHGRVGLEHQHPRVGQQREVDASVVQIEAASDRGDGGQRALAERSAGIFQKAALLVDFPRAMLHAGSGVMHHPVGRDGKVIAEELAVDEHDAVLAVAAVRRAGVVKARQIVVAREGAKPALERFDVFAASQSVPATASAEAREQRAVALGIAYGGHCDIVIRNDFRQRLSRHEKQQAETDSGIFDDEIDRHVVARAYQREQADGRGRRRRKPIRASPIERLELHVEREGMLAQRQQQTRHLHEHIGRIRIGKLPGDQAGNRRRRHTANAGL